MFLCKQNKFDCQVLSEQVHSNNSLVLSPSIWRELRLNTLTNWKHPPYLWHNFNLIYLMKVVSMIALPWHIFVFFLNLFLQKGLQIHSWKPCGITCMVAKSIIVVHQLFISYNVFLYNFIPLFTKHLDHLDMKNMLVMVWMLEINGFTS